MGKRKGAPSHADEEAQASDDSAGLSAYELERKRLIQRNRARLEALGIPAAVEDLFKEHPTRPKPKKRPKVAAQPTRHSTRLQGDAAAGQLPDDESTQFAIFLIDGECPKCGRVFNTGHRRHFAGCTGTGVRRRQGHVQIEGMAEQEELTPEERAEEEREAAAREKERLARQKDKLRALELEGLIDFTDDHAQFVCIGSTGSHYRVTLADKLSCQCMDFRTRHRVCKHLRLVLTRLGIEDHPDKWHEAVDRNLDSLQSANEEKKPKKATRTW